MSEQTFYDILEVSENSSLEEIKKAYRKLSLLNHPDKTNNDETKTKKFKLINEAYNTLSDKKLKSDYDFNLQLKRNPGMNGMNGMNGGMGNIFHNTHGVNMNMNINPEDIIAQLFMNGVMGGIRPNFGEMGKGPIHFQTFHSKPGCIIKKLSIPLELAYRGGSCHIEIDRVVLENNIQVNEKETVYITLDKGVDNDEIILLQGKGNVINNVKGDVKIVIEIQNTTEYIRDGLDLKLTRKITLKESLTGFNFVLLHISGNTYNINNTKGNIIHPNYKKTLPNMGMSRGEFTGNLIINFEVLFPESLSIEAIDKLLEIL